MSGSCADFGEAYTGSYDWNDYSFTATVIPQLGSYHRINFRVQGAIRSYALGLADGNTLVLYKNENGYRQLYTVDFPWELNQEYTFEVTVRAATISVMHENTLIIEYRDEERPYLHGQIGASVIQ
ncbi:hypothetical protein [Paenibacillus sp. NPDC058071]|uniref:hypothetical protein n=1 Tax=Paenibacillus sp. NPDC058071 TaxID=3346326 RepID=UPI0036DF41AE